MADAKAVQDGLRAAQAAQIAKFGWTVSPDEIKAAGAHPIKAIEAKLTAREKELTSMKGVDLVKVCHKSRDQSALECSPDVFY